MIKHAHHEFDVDVPGKDSWRHREAGATEVLVSSDAALGADARIARRGRAAAAGAAGQDVARSISCVVEGFKREPHRKIEVHRAANGKPLLFPDDPGIVGIATDAAVETTAAGRPSRRYRGDRRPDAALGDADRGAACGSDRRGLTGSMAQLSDDCFAFGGPMMSVDEAVGLIAARVSAVAEIETVALVDADGRILAHDIAAPLPLPPFTNSAVDGYAVRERATFRKTTEQAFPVAGRVQAGASAQEPIKPGHAVRIFTGAPMPAGADTVFMQEDVRAR